MKEELGKFFHENLLDDNQVTVDDIRRMKMVFKTQNYDIDILQEYIKDNFEYIIKCSIDTSKIIDEFMKMDNIKEFILRYLNNNFDDFSSFVSKKVIFDNYLLFVEKNRNLLNSYLKCNKKEYIKYLLIDGMFDDYNKDLDLVNEIVVMIVDEILEHEKKEYIDIERLKSGVYSNVIQIGSKVIKLGVQRETYSMPNTSVLLQPLIRKDLSSLSSLRGTIEVMEKVETREYFSFEQLYQIYKKARDKGIVLTDLKADNVGVLLKDNVLHWSKVINDDMNNRGLNGSNDEILGEGNTVLLDSDKIYLIGDYLEKINARPLSELNEFEKRYLEENSGGKHK